jgi:hypothetical protein
LWRLGHEAEKGQRCAHLPSLSARKLGRKPSPAATLWLCHRSAMVGAR